jgi:hypothetical protein
VVLDVRRGVRWETLQELHSLLVRHDKEKRVERAGRREVSERKGMFVPQYQFGSTDNDYFKQGAAIMKRPRLRLSGIVATLLGATTLACGGLKVQTDFDPAVDFSRYTTFAVLEEAGDATAPGFWDTRIKTAMARTLAAKGWRQVESPEEADVAVGYQLTTEERSSYQTVSTGWGGYGYGGWGGWYDPYWGGGMASSTTTETRYEVGTLIIAMFDVAQKQMIYVSTGSGTIDEAQRTPEQAQADVNKVVDEMLKDFPPTGG